MLYLWGGNNELISQFCECWFIFVFYGENPLKFWHLTLNPLWSF